MATKNTSVKSVELLGKQWTFAKIEHRLRTLRKTERGVSAEQVALFMKVECFDEWRAYKTVAQWAESIGYSRVHVQKLMRIGKDEEVFSLFESGTSLRSCIAIQTLGGKTTAKKIGESRARDYRAEAIRFAKANPDSDSQTAAKIKTLRENVDAERAAMLGEIVATGNNPKLQGLWHDERELKQTVSELRGQIAQIEVLIGEHEDAIKAINDAISAELTRIAVAHAASLALKDQQIADREVLGLEGST